ncbi:DUF1707 domain-containing protein [Streptosporangium sp. NPDC050855]|uniref:DUF1707 domain-containing protein n=1 Tax=Streptosporangium sp. NPDC050855 TaxID=3366194 RepID=UPI0037B581AB
MTPREGLRIGDAERDAAMEFLRENYAQGRLTHEELDERLELALSARTGGDLARVSADLPGRDGEGVADVPGAPDPTGPWGHADPWERAMRSWAHAGGPWGHGRRPGGHGARPWADGPGRSWAHHHPDAWMRHRAAREYRRRERRGGPGFPVPLILLLVAGVAFTGLGVLKVLLAIALVLTVAGALRRGRARTGGHSRIGPPGTA